MALNPSVLSAQYVDPGSASVLWQLLLAGVFGVVFTFRQHIVSLARAFLNRFRRSGNEPRSHE
jgi:hypothetical protein